MAMAKQCKTEARTRMHLIAFMDIVATKETCKKYLTDHHLLCQNILCHNCNTPMASRAVSSSVCQDGEVWRCPTCRRKKSLRKDSFFEVRLNYVIVHCMNIYIK